MLASTGSKLFVRIGRNISCEDAAAGEIQWPVPPDSIGLNLGAFVQVDGTIVVYYLEPRRLQDVCAVHCKDIGPEIPWLQLTCQNVSKVIFPSRSSNTFLLLTYNPQVKQFKLTIEILSIA